MIELLHPEIERYLNRLSQVDDPTLRAMEARAEKDKFPIVGPQVGRLLLLLARLQNAQRILELGSGYGYSAYWFARALGEDGELILTDYQSKNLELARDFLRQGEFRCRFHFHAGDALAQLEQLEGMFDIILIDVDKPSYPKAFDRASVRLRTGGLLITDNTLWSGRVLDREPDEATRGVLDYTRKVFHHPEFFSLILPVRDGVAVSIKL